MSTRQLKTRTLIFTVKAWLFHLEMMFWPEIVSTRIRQSILMGRTKQYSAMVVSSSIVLRNGGLVIVSEHSLVLAKWNWIEAIDTDISFPWQDMKLSLRYRKSPYGTRSFMSHNHRRMPFEQRTANRYIVSSRPRRAMTTEI